MAQLYFNPEEPKHHSGDTVETGPCEGCGARAEKEGWGKNLCFADGKYEEGF